MTADEPRLSEQDRGAPLDQLKNAYMDGVLDHEELDSARTSMHKL